MLRAEVLEFLVCARICAQAEAFKCTQNPPLSLISIIPSIHALCNPNKVMAAFMASYFVCCEVFCNLSSDWRLIAHTDSGWMRRPERGQGYDSHYERRTRKKRFQALSHHGKPPLHSPPYCYLQAGIIMIKDEPGYTAVDPTV